MTSNPTKADMRSQCAARTKSGVPCRSPATKKGRCRLHGGARGSGAPPGKRNGQYRHGERTKAAIAERQKFSALLKMLRDGLANAPSQGDTSLYRRAGLVSGEIGRGHGRNGG